MQIFEKLLMLPLFQGMSSSEITSVAGKTKFAFHRVAKGKKVVSEGDPCQNLLFLLEGSLQVTSRADDNSYSMVEELAAPDVIQPERIFGLTQRYSKTFVALTECRLVSVSKAEMLRLSEEHMIFQLNLLNIISTQSQRITHQPWRVRPQGIRNKIIRFVETHSMRPAGEKTLNIKMETLATHIAESRLNVSRELNAMQQEGLISITRGIIRVPALEKLLSL
ncbi:MAG: Crp/Fnr family transcriptional regulator [Prevotella sp.]|nr:Crp/Fnr family transcriptional regulator [Prevotella sp.]